MANITENSKVTLALVLALLGTVAVGGGVWGQTISRVGAAEAKINALEPKVDEGVRKQAAQEAVQRQLLETVREVRDDVKELRKRQSR